MAETILPAKPAYLRNSAGYSLKFNTLLEAFENRVKSGNDFLIFMDSKNDEHLLTGEEAGKKVDAVVGHLLSGGLEKNDRVIIMLPTGPEFVAAYFGAIKAGGIPVTVSHPTGTANIEKYLDHIKHIMEDCGARFFITFNKVKMLIGGMISPLSGVICLFSDEITNEPAEKINHFLLPRITADDVALIQYTSGSTGNPKGVMLTHRNLLHNVHGIGVAGAINDSDIGIIWLPLFHDMGLIGGLFTTIYWNIPLILMQPEVFLFRPQWWLTNAARYRATITVSPNAGYHICATRITDEMLDGADLSALRIMMNGAEPIDTGTLGIFIDRFGKFGLRDDIFLPVYGMAEDSLAATFPMLGAATVTGRFNREAMEKNNVAVDSENDDPAVSINLVSVGYPLLGQELCIADEWGTTLNERQVGEILVKSPSVTIGYFGDAEKTANAIKNGWLHTGDLGFILNGMLFISGRKKEIIIKRGKNIFPYDIERIAMTVPGVRLGLAAAFAVENRSQGTEDIVLFCETKLKNKEDIGILRKRIAAEVLAKTGVGLDDIWIVPRGTIPKTTSGKIQRVICKEYYLHPDVIPKKHKNAVALTRTFVLSGLHFVSRAIK